MKEYINGNNFLDFADFAIDFDHRELSTQLYKKNAIIYCKTDFLDLLFNYIKLSNRKYILITHMSDYGIDKMRFNKAPDSIKLWFAQNAIHNDSKLLPVPLGLENHKGKSKGKFTNHDWFVKYAPMLRDKNKEMTLYCNWNPDTNREVRTPIINQIKESGLNYVHESGLTFEEYCTNMAKHQFVICPPGNGADTHRLWEALYLGCYPITLTNRIYQFYDLPILQVDKWEDLNEDLLIEHMEKWGDRDPDEYEQLKMSWWENHIKEEFKNLK